MAEQIQFTQLFEALSTTDAKALEDGITRISNVFADRPTSIYLPEVLPYIPIGLQHLNPQVRLLVLKLLISPDAAQQFIASGMLSPVLSVPNDVSTAVAATSTDVLIKISCFPAGLDLLISPQGPLQQLKTDVGAEKRIRLLNLAAGIASKSPAGRDAILQNGYLGALASFGKVSHSDLLEALNLVAILTQVLDTTHGVEFLSSINLLDSLVVQNDFEELLVLDLLRLYGKLLSKEPPKDKSWNDFPFLSILISNLEAPNPSLQEAATSAIGLVGSTQSGIKLLEKEKKLWSIFGELVNSSHELQRNTALHSLSLILEQRKTDEDTLLSIYNQISSSLSNQGVTGGLMARLSYYLSTPFPDIRFICFEVERNLALHSWGVQVLLNHPGYLEWLLDRETEKKMQENKQGAEWKFEIIKALVLAHPNSEPTLKAMVGAENHQRLCDYLKQGAFYQKSSAGTIIADKSKS